MSSNGEVYIALAGFRSCLEIRIVEVAPRLRLLQGAMGAKIRIVVDYMTPKYITNLAPVATRQDAIRVRRRSRLRIPKQLLMAAVAKSEGITALFYPAICLLPWRARLAPNMQNKME
uniref:Uncharacterized protein n=1 Tax=Candidatus Kentrum eta TaxID=2126337 RepID=A0A450UM69_9GAMM|nr:MAG: hypothetical protein BECKH772A_GA0070896_100596 [Candidatus Kentron sp. H]VFJ94401.1 MAG: hypothetical protein BECKH772B_GA0070898_100616 [Candidatus Kentron sp. H]VFK01052.1 MAG: hypothetical protein BECKH772C_GA0070978_100574 [Candidatus Kentron sp. H]